MPLHIINQGPLHPAKAVSHFRGSWLPAQLQSLATPNLPQGLKVTFRAFQTQGIFSQCYLLLPSLLEMLFLSKLKSISKNAEFYPTFFFSWRESLGLRSCTTLEFSGSLHSHDFSRHKGNSSFGYYLSLFAVISLFKFLCVY